MGNHLTAAGITIEYLRYRSGIPGIQKDTWEGDTKSGIMYMMKYRKAAKGEFLVPETIQDRHKLEAVPDIHTTLGNNARGISDTSVQGFEYLCRYIEANASKIFRIEIGLVKQTFESADVIEVVVGNIHS